MSRMISEASSSSTAAAALRGGEGRVGEEPQAIPSAEELLLEIYRLRRKLRRLREGGASAEEEGATSDHGRRRDLEAGADAVPRGWGRQRRGPGLQPGAFRVGGPGHNDDHDGVAYDDDDAEDGDATTPSGSSRGRAPFAEVLWEAELVPDPPDHPAVGAVEVLEVHDATLVRQGQLVQRAFGLVFLTSVAVALLVGLPLGLPGPPAKPDYELVPVLSLQDKFNSSLSSSTLDAIRLGGTTPQAEAYRWLFAKGGHPPLPRSEAVPRMRHRFALAALHFSVRQGSNSTSEASATGWLNHSVHECLWDGIGCAIGTADAIAHCKDRLGILLSVSCRLSPAPALDSLDLAGKGLSGTIPEEISLLKSAGLQSLRLQGNRLVGSIPTGVGTLTTLRQLNLDHNQLQGTIPPSLGDLRLLRTLSLSENGLSGTIPLAVTNLVGLMELDVSRNRLVGRIPRKIRRMKSLEVFDASGNHLEGTIPSEMSQLTNMVRLELSDNSFQNEVLPLLRSMSSLRVLDISYDMLSGTIPSSLDNFGSLASFTVSSPSWLGASIPSELGRLDSLALQESFTLRHSIVLSAPDP